MTARFVSSAGTKGILLEASSRTSASARRCRGLLAIVHAVLRIDIAHKSNVCVLCL